MGKYDKENNEPLWDIKKKLKDLEYLNYWSNTFLVLIFTTLFISMLILFDINDKLDSKDIYPLVGCVQAVDHKYGNVLINNKEYELCSTDVKFIERGDKIKINKEEEAFGICGEIEILEKSVDGCDCAGSCPSTIERIKEER